MKHTILTLILLSIFYIAQAQVFENAPPSSSMKGSLNETYNTPFSSDNGSINRPLKVVDPNDTGDDFNNPGGINDTGNVNDNNVAIADGTWILVLASVIYGIIKRNKKTRDVN